MLAVAALGAGTLAVGCAPQDPRPNILFVVWDTARADRMSLYGHGRATTPALDVWAEGALVFDDVVSAAGYTVPSHASMFTGLLPSEHCTSGDETALSNAHTTLAERLHASGYATFLYAENPHLTRQTGFAQGFERSEHPWSERHIERAMGILRDKVRGDASSELTDRVAAMERGESALTPWNVKAAGELAEVALLDFLDDLEAGRPFFAFVNYMEAHRPYIPPRRYRERFLDDEAVERSYAVDRSWSTIWEFTFGQRELPEADLELTRATYDAALAELDDLFASLLTALDERGALDNTVVVLTSDHGEHLGEQHMFDHQSTLYESVLRVPLVIHHPKLVSPGRRSDPVMNFDVFPTLLELAGAALPEGARISARSLLSPEADRARLAEEPAAESSGVRAMRSLHPGWDPTPWIRSQRALYLGRYKWIASSTGASELYDLRSDPGELRNVSALREIDATRMRAALARSTSELSPCTQGKGAIVSKRDRELLQMLGYESAPGPPPGGGGDGGDGGDGAGASEQRSGGK